MNAKEKEAFDKWVEDVKSLGLSPANHVGVAWAEACAYKQKEIESIELELWKALGTLGYPVPEHVPFGDYKCDLCDSKSKLILTLEAKQEALLEAIRIISGVHR